MDKRRKAPGEQIITERVPVALSVGDLSELDRLSQTLRMGRSTVMRNAFRYCIESNAFTTGFEKSA